MSCCGDQRAAMRHEPPPAGGRQGSYWSPGPTDFVYSGQGRLIVKGPLTGTEYRFSSGGPAVRVHPSDVASLAGVPGLTVAR
jgi:hypothetical protein